MLTKLKKELASYVNGAEILTAWMGAGGVPVPRDQAEARAAVCFGCPKNRPRKWYELVKAGVAGEIKRQLGLRQHLKRFTTYDSGLGVCDACGCFLKLKVDTPLEHIERTLSDEDINDLAEICWVRKELCQKSTRSR